MQYNLAYKKNVKRISLRVLNDGSIQVIAPQNSKQQIIEAFVEEKNDWIQRQQKKVFFQQEYRKKYNLINDYRNGGNVAYLGIGYPLRVQKAGNQALKWTGAEFIATGCEGEEQVQKLVESFYRCQMIEKVIPSVNRDARNHICREDLPNPQIEIRKMKASWGSCFYKENRIKLNLWLAIAPMECIRQVLIHEYIHFYQPNHSKDFYRMLQQAEPEYKQLTKQLCDSISLREL